MKGWEFSKVNIEPGINSPETNTARGDKNQQGVNCDGSEALIVEDQALKSLRARPPFRVYLRQLWQRRHFVWADARSKALNSGRGTFLGKSWIILNPILQVAVFVIVFGLVLKVDRGMDNFIGFLVIGVIYFGFLSAGLSGGINLIQSQRNMIKSFHFPRAALALSTTLRNLIDNIPPAFVAIVLAILTQLNQPIHWTVVFVIPTFVLIHIFNLGVTLIVARLTAFIPDTKSLVQLLQRALFFVSGIFYPLSRFDTYPTLKLIMQANPIYQFLSVVRSVVLDGAVPPLSLWGYITVWSFGLLAFGLVYFWQAEARYSGVRA